MKTLMFFSLSLLAFIGCSKNEESQTNSFPSAWKETDHYYSIGGPIIWKQTEPSAAEVIEFKENNVFYSSQRPELNGYVLEEINASTATAKLKLFKSGQKDTTYWFLKTITRDTIEIGFSGCIEGCGKRFISTTNNQP